MGSRLFGRTCSQPGMNSFLQWYYIINLYIQPRSSVSIGNSELAPKNPPLKFDFPPPDCLPCLSYDHPNPAFGPLVSGVPTFDSHYPLDFAPRIFTLNKAIRVDTAEEQISMLQKFGCESLGSAKSHTMLRLPAPTCSPSHPLLLR